MSKNDLWVEASYPPEDMVPDECKDALERERAIFADDRWNEASYD